MRYYRPILILLFILSFGAPFCPVCSAQSLQPDQIALIINTENPDSRSLAEYYCQKRNVPESHIIALPMPDTETITCLQYHEKIAPLIRARLNQPDFQNKIKCLLTMRGVPLRIENFIPTGAVRARCDLIINLLDQRFDQIVKLTHDYQRLAGIPLTDPTPDQTFQLPRDLRPRQSRSQVLLQNAAAAGEAARQAVDSLSANDPLRSEKLLRLHQLNVRWDGLQGRYFRLAAAAPNILDLQQNQEVQKQLTEMQNQLTTINNRIKKLTPETSNLDTQKERYQLVYEAVGLVNLCRLLLAERNGIDDEDSFASFDSELSLILWEPYSLFKWQTNHLKTWPSNLDTTNAAKDPAAQTQPILMVARLDGPTPAIARGLIDKALAAEKTILRGAAYIDARGRQKPNPQFGSYEHTDESLRLTAKILRENTALRVVLNDREALFPADACPDTTLYCGWYSVRQYIDSFTFNPGAVGFHIASFEAETLRLDDPNINIWCKRLLEKGITATLGSVTEPYLLSFPLPHQFFADLTGGQYSLVECFYRTKPYNSWRLTLIGDPLYRPQFAKTQLYLPLK